MEHKFGVKWWVTIKFLNEALTKVRTKTCKTNILFPEKYFEKKNIKPILNILGWKAMNTDTLTVITSKTITPLLQLN